MSDAGGAGAARGTSGVVIRCPNCGTTQDSLGECETCHHDVVRYYCTNHTPGRWLDGPGCAECAAREEREAREGPRTPPPPRPAPRPTPRRTPATGPIRTPPPAPPPRRPTPTVGPPSPYPRADEWPPRRDPRSDASTPDRGTEPPWLESPVPPLRRRPRRESPSVIVPTRIEEALPAARRAAGVARTAIGCAVRIVMLIVVVLLIAAFLLFGGPLREWVVDMGRQFGLVEGGVPALTQEGIDAYHAGDLVAAERALRDAAGAYPRSALALQYLARIRTDAGDLDRAVEYLGEALRREPGNATAHRELAGVHLTRADRRQSSDAGDVGAYDDLTRAERHYRLALGLAPNDRRAAGYLACVLSRQQGRESEATAFHAQAGSGPWDACAGTGMR